MKKLLILLLCFFTLMACGSPKNTNGKKYIDQLVNYQVKDKNIANTTDNKEFDAFLDKVFIESMESDYMTMHFSVIDYKKYGIEKPPVDLGEIKYELDTENVKYMQDQLKELQSFDYDSLSYRQQYDYDALEYSLYETLAQLSYWQYNFLFSSGSCLPENLISNFVDYTFYDKESVDDYITCLKDIDRYINDALTYTQNQSKAGYPLLDSWIDYTEDCVDSMISKTEDNELIVSFDKRIDNLDFLTAAEKDSYKQENKKIVLEEVLPSYEAINDNLEKYRGKAKTEKYVLAKLDKDYALLTYMLYSSSNKDLKQTMQEMQDNLDILESEYISCMYDDNSYDKFKEYYEDAAGSMGLVGKECLEYLRTSLAHTYPDLGEVDYTVEELDPKTAPASAVAYYWPSPVDNLNQNIIRTNPNNMQEGSDTYGTLSHEGFPGHLYQHIFYLKTNPHNFRSSISFTGYTEGYAVMASYDAYQFSGIDNQYAASALFFENNYYFLVYSIIDLGVNYFDWKAKDIVDYFDKNSQLFAFDKETAEFYRNFMIEMPGVYCSYGIGLSNLMTLRAYAQDAKGNDFDLVKYNEAILKNGPLPFNILQKAVDEYIAQ